MATFLVFVRLVARHVPLVTFFLLWTTTGCSNVIRSGLMNSNTVFLDPNMNRTVHVQARNISENQQVSLGGIEQKLAAKGYQIKSDPEQANYWIQAKVLYCHKAAEGVTPESVAKAGPGAGISSGGTSMASGDNPMAGMAGMPDMNAMMAQAMRGMGGGRAGFGGMGLPGMQSPPKEEGVTYVCVTDVQVTDRKLGKTIGQPAGATGTAPDRKGDGSLSKVLQMRMVGHVRQKDLDIPEATPIIQEKITTGIAGLF